MHHIRNFSIIAHIDHGKSTLADRMIEMTKTVAEREMRDQVLDGMELERERGITIKMQPVRMRYPLPEHLQERCQSEMATFNLIDTPGHVDFSYEVSRSLAAVEGTIVLVDATQGIQAQTTANIYLALEQDLVIIPAVNKIDLPHARPQQVKEELAAMLGVEESEIFEVSGKTGEGVDALLQAVVEEIPPPQKNNLIEEKEPEELRNNPFRALIFDSSYDPYKGVIAHVRVFEGTIKRDADLYLLAKEQRGHVVEAGIFAPEHVATETLSSGEIGYIATGLKDMERVRVGDTIVAYAEREHTAPVSEYQEPRPMVFVSVFPENADDFATLEDALGRLKLADASLQYEREAKEVLGKGFRCGFLGMLHLEIITERLRREYGLDLVVTTPSVSYQVETVEGETLHVYTPSDLPDPSQIEAIWEPWVRAELLTPSEHMGGLMTLLENSRGVFRNTEYMSEERVILVYDVPLIKIIGEFYEKVKSVSSGFASLNYEPIEYQQADVVRMDIYIAQERADALSQMVYRDEVETVGRDIVTKLKDLLPRQQFSVALQAAVGSKIFARETIPALKKDVTAKLYGGDVTRKRKLLEKQKEGKKKMQQTGKMKLPKEVYLKVFQS